MTTPETPSPGAPASVPPPHESLGERVGDFFRREAPAIEADAAAVLKGHSAELFHAGAELLEKYPGAEAIAVRVLRAALGIAAAAGISL